MDPVKPVKAEAKYTWYCPVCVWPSHRSDEINFHYRSKGHGSDQNTLVPDLKCKFRLKKHKPEDQAEKVVEHIKDDSELLSNEVSAILVDAKYVKKTVKEYKKAVNATFPRNMAPIATTQGKRKVEDLGGASVSNPGGPSVSNLFIATSSRNLPHATTSDLGHPNPKYLDKNPDLAAAEPVTSVYPEVVGDPKAAGLPVESEMRLNVSSKFPFIEKPAVIEERNGEIEVHVVNNDGTQKNSIILGGLKVIFQKQLPKMPKDYIARLVFDRTHISMAIVKHPLEVVGGITYRPFENRQFAEIVFCAISSDQQVKGYGSHLMNHLKDYVKATSDIMHFLTYADNYAIGYFKKQGFSKDIELPGERWVGYIKDYEGGTLMHCEMLPKIRYLTAARMLHKQKEAIAAKMAAQKRSQVIHPPPAQFQGPGPIKPITDPYSLPGLRESGWTPEMDALSRQPRHGPNYAVLSHLLASMQRHSQSWPFANPVNKDDVQDYYDVITEPMDLNTMEKKLEKDNYVEPEDFIKDAKLIFNNCRKYNGESSLYVKCANKLEKSMWSEIKKIPEWSHLAEA